MLNSVDPLDTEMESEDEGHCFVETTIQRSLDVSKKIYSKITNLLFNATILDVGFMHICK